MNHYTWEQLKVGLTGSFDVVIDDRRMESFCEITGDVNPLHNDEDFAKEKGYGTRVCFGMLTASFLSTLAGVYIPGENSLIQEVDVKFIRPVLSGDHLTVTGTVQELNDTVRQIVLKVVIVNQRREKVLRGKMKVGLLDE